MAMRAAPERAAPNLSGPTLGTPQAAQAREEMAKTFEDDVTQALIPFVDKTYRTLAGSRPPRHGGTVDGRIPDLPHHARTISICSRTSADSAALAGLLEDRKLDLKTDFNGVFADPAAFAKKVHLLYLGVGTAEAERFTTRIRGLHTALTEAGIEHVYWESPGTDHEWQTWRRNLKDFASRLFRKK